MTDPKPMDPERLAGIFGPLRRQDPEDDSPVPVWSDVAVRELLADRDHQEAMRQHAEQQAVRLRLQYDGQCFVLNEALADSKHYRSRCTVGASDVQAAGVTWDQCLAVTMRKRGAHAFLVGMLGVVCDDFEINEVVLPEPDNEAEAIAGCVTYLAMFSTGPACDILDEMAASDPGTTRPADG